MENRLLVKISLLVVTCLLACPIGGFLASRTYWICSNRGFISCKNVSICIQYKSGLYYIAGLFYL